MQRKRTLKLLSVTTGAGCGTGFGRLGDERPTEARLTIAAVLKEEEYELAHGAELRTTDHAAAVPLGGGEGGKSVDCEPLFHASRTIDAICDGQVTGWPGAGKLRCYAVLSPCS